MTHNTTSSSLEQEYLNGFCQFSDCARDNDYLAAEEFNAMTSTERQGYTDAIRSANYAEFSEWRERTNSFGDQTNGGGF